MLERFYARHKREIDRRSWRAVDGVWWTGEGKVRDVFGRWEGRLKVGDVCVLW